MMLRRRTKTPRATTEIQTGTHTLCEPVQWKCTSTRHESCFFNGILLEKCRATRLQRNSARACAVEREHVTNAISSRNLQAKVPGQLCASLRNQNAHQHVTRALLDRNVQEKAPLWEPAQSNVNMSQAPL